MRAATSHFGKIGCGQFCENTARKKCKMTDFEKNIYTFMDINKIELK